MTPRPGLHFERGSPTRASASAVLEADEPGGPVGAGERVVPAVTAGKDVAGAVVAAAEGAELPARLAVDARVDDTVDRERLLHPAHVLEDALGRDEEADDRARGRLRLGQLDRLTEGGGEREAVEVDAERDTAELGVVAAAEPRGELHHARPVGAEDELGVGRAVGHSESIGREARRLDGLLDRVRARPGVGERDAEGGPGPGEPVGDRQRVEDAADGEGVDGDLRPWHELLHEREPVPRRSDCGGNRLRELGRVGDDRKPLLALAVDGLHDRGQRQVVPGHRGHVPARLRNAVLRQALALAVLEDGERGRLGRDRMRQARVRGEPGGDGDRPVDARSDDPVHLLGARELADRRLVLDRDDRPAVGIREADRGRVAVAGDDEEASLPGGAVQAELRRPRPED